MNNLTENQIIDYKVMLLSNFEIFCKEFFPKVEGYPFKIEQPSSRPSHHRIIINELQKCQLGLNPKLLINCPPGANKTTLLVLWVAWCLARYPSSRFIYASYSLRIAEGPAQKIRSILSLPDFGFWFGVYLSQDTRSKSRFTTTEGGGVFAAGLNGSITGIDGGRQYKHEFGGAVIIDDAHKAEEVSE